MRNFQRKISTAVNKVLFKIESKSNQGLIRSNADDTLSLTSFIGLAIFNSGYPGGANMCGVRNIFDDFL